MYDLIYLVINFCATTVLYYSDPIMCLICSRQECSILVFFYRLVFVIFTYSLFLMDFTQISNFLKTLLYILKLFFLPVLLSYNRYTALYKFMVYITMI